jgi:hypothetical protein
MEHNKLDFVVRSHVSVHTPASFTLYLLPQMRIFAYPALCA